MAGQNLQPPATSSSTQQISLSLTAERAKVVLTPGHSLMDWIRLGRSGKDLTGVGGQFLEVTEEELKKHNKHDDAWIAIRGKVYNITPYLDFHPGGVDELMRGAGIDGTVLFDEIHKWVNAETMLEKCVIGKLKPKEIQSKGSITSRASNRSNVKFKLAPPPQFVEKPKYEWFQNSKCVTVVVYTMVKGLHSDVVVIDRAGHNICITIFIESHTYTMHIELDQLITSDYNVRVDKEYGKVEIVLPKDVAEVEWTSLGKELEEHNTFVKTKDRARMFRPCKILSVENVTHDTKLFCVALPNTTRMCVPLGYHVHVKHCISETDIDRCYTAVLPSLRHAAQDDRVSHGAVVYLMIKIYDNGALSSWLGTLNSGDEVSVSDFEGSFERSALDRCTHLVLCAAGSGFTPMVRLMYESLVADECSKRHVTLLFFVRKKKDIYWKDQLDELAAKNDRFCVKYVLSEPDEDWTGPTGRVQKAHLQDHIPNVEDGIHPLLCTCGPIMFTKEVLRLAKELGCKDEHIHAFEG